MLQVAMTKQDYHHGELRDALLDAAQARLCSQSLETLSMRMLAKDVGVSPGAPYHHFKDKSALRLALCQRGFDQLSNDLDKYPALDGKIKAYFAFAVSNRALFELMFAPQATFGHSAAKLHPHAAPVYKCMEKALDDDFPSANEHSAIAVWAFLHGTALLLAASPITMKLGEKNPLDFVIGFVERLRSD